MAASVRYLKIQDWAAEDRPREKLIQRGPSALNNAELLGVLIGSGIQNVNSVDLARVILKENGNDLNAVAKLSVQELQKFNGIGEAKAVVIASAMELANRRQNNLPAIKQTIDSARRAYEVMKTELMGKIAEEFWTIILNRAQRLLKKYQISKGGLTKTIADPRTIFKSALQHDATSIILVHNHPSGNPEPSNADIQLTKALVKAGKILDIRVLDHIIFTDNGFFSFNDCDLMQD